MNHQFMQPKGEGFGRVMQLRFTAVKTVRDRAGPQSGPSLHSISLGPKDRKVQSRSSILGPRPAHAEAYARITKKGGGVM
jgi:hypothetical protein